MKNITAPESNMIQLKNSIDKMEKVVIVIIDKYYRYVYYNDAHRKTMNRVYNVDVSEGDNLLQMIPIGVDREVQKHHYDLALKGISTSNIDSYGMNDNQYFDTYYTPVYEENQIVGVSIVSIDASSRVVNGYSRRDSVEHVREIYASMPQAYSLVKMIYDFQGEPIDFVFVEVNKAYEDLFDRKSNDIIGVPIKVVSPNVEDYWISRLGNIAKKGESEHFEEYIEVIDKYVSTYAYSPKEGYVASLTIDVNDDTIYNERNQIKYYHAGPLHCNIKTNIMTYKGKSIQLNPAEAKLFFMLCDSKHAILTFEEASKDMNLDSLNETKDLLKVYVHRLRRKLAILGCDEVSIQSHYGKGYSIMFQK